MDCLAFCIASSCQTKQLFEAFKEGYEVCLYRDVVHWCFPKEGRDIFIFPYGAVVIWGLLLKGAEKYLRPIKKFLEQPLEELERDKFTYNYEKEAKFCDDHFILPNKKVFTKLAFSYGLSQSVKLGAFEGSIAKVFDKTKHLPEELLKKGKIPLSRKAIRKKMGELFLERSYINLHVDVLDTPEFFWEYPELEPLYLLVANELEINLRGKTLNHRLDVVGELFEMLGNELNHQHSSRLEWTIIWLIIIEVLISLLSVFKIL